MSAITLKRFDEDAYLDHCHATVVAASEAGIETRPSATRAAAARPATPAR
jgi:hypothetical protein